MERLELTVTGPEAGKVPTALGDLDADDRFDYDGDGFAVIVTEQFFYRTVSNLQATIIVDLVEETTVEITLIAGGGKSGFGKEDFGAESRTVHSIAERIERWCDRNGLEVDR